MSIQYAGPSLAGNLSLVALNDQAIPLFHDGVAVPTEISRRFAPGQFDQTFVDFHLVQGNSPAASKNTSIGWWQISGFPSDLRLGSEVIFRIEEDGLLTIKAVLDKKNLDVRFMSEGAPRVQLRK